MRTKLKANLHLLLSRSVQDGGDLYLIKGSCVCVRLAGWRGWSHVTGGRSRGRQAAANERRETSPGKGQSPSDALYFPCVLSVPLVHLASSLAFLFIRICWFGRCCRCCCRRRCVFLWAVRVAAGPVVVGRIGPGHFIASRAAELEPGARSRCVVC
jgi:hypothetical protein